MENWVEAVVQKIISDGKHGPYAVATAAGIEGSITFGLDSAVWQENVNPTPGNLVKLTDFQKKQSGWRALKARFLKPFDEYQSDKENSMSAASRITEKWRRKFFPTSADKAWKDWVDFKNPGFQELVKFVKDPQNKDEYKARALYILLAPDLTSVPFYWKNSDRTNESFLRTTYGTDMFETISNNILLYAEDLVKEFYTEVNKKPAKQSREERVVYNDLVIKLLTRLTEEEGTELFRLFEIKYPRYEDSESESNYDPYLSLMTQKKIPEIWKRKADGMFRSDIEAGISRADASDHHSSLKTYAYNLQTHILGSRPYSNALLTDQIEFLIQTAKRRKNPTEQLIMDWQIAPMLKCLTSVASRRDFCDLVLSEKKDGFQAYSQETLDAAELIASCLESNDPRIQTLTNAIVKGKQKLHLSALANKERADREKAILAKIQKSR